MPWSHSASVSSAEQRVQAGPLAPGLLAGAAAAASDSTDGKYGE
ncbi:hypothetical protein [Kitasatospora sp. NPDC001095]